MCAIYDRERLLRVLTEDPKHFLTTVERLYNWDVQRRNRLEDAQVAQHSAEAATVSPRSVPSLDVNRFYASQMAWAERRDKKLQERQLQKSVEEEAFINSLAQMQPAMKCGPVKRGTPAMNTARKCIARECRQVKETTKTTPEAKSRRSFPTPQGTIDDCDVHPPPWCSARRGSCGMLGVQKWGPKCTSGSAVPTSYVRNRAARGSRVANPESTARLSKPRQGIHSCDHRHGDDIWNSKPCFVPCVNPGIRYVSPTGHTKPARSRTSSVKQKSESHVFLQSSSPSARSENPPTAEPLNSARLAAFLHRQNLSLQKRQAKIEEQRAQRRVAAEATEAEACTFTPQLSPRSRRMIKNRHQSDCSPPLSCRTTSGGMAGSSSSARGSPRHSAAISFLQEKIEYVKGRGAPHTSRRDVSMFQDIQHLQLKRFPRQQDQDWSRAPSSRRTPRGVHHWSAAPPLTPSIVPAAESHRGSPPLPYRTSLASPTLSLDGGGYDSLLRHCDLSTARNEFYAEAASSPQQGEIKEVHLMSPRSTGPHEHEDGKHRPQVLLLPTDDEALDVYNAAQNQGKLTDPVLPNSQDGVDPLIRLPSSVLLELSNWWTTLTQRHNRRGTRVLPTSEAPSLFEMRLPRSVMVDAMRALIEQVGHATPYRNDNDLPPVLEERNGDLCLVWTSRMGPRELLWPAAPIESIASFSIFVQVYAWLQHSLPRIWH